MRSPLLFDTTNPSRAAGRSGILVNMVQVLLLGRDYGNLFVIWACRGLRFVLGAYNHWGRERERSQLGEDNHCQIMLLEVLTVSKSWL